MFLTGRTWFWRCVLKEETKGDRVLKSSKIDLVLGESEMSYEEEETAADTHCSNRRNTS
jgi:hypothetical protein